MKNNIYQIEEADPYYLAQGDTGAIVIAKNRKRAGEIALLNKRERL